MAAVDYRTLAGDILERVGGEANVASLAHCATRLRFKLKDAGKADKAAVEKLPGVITVMEAGGQFQVVIGNNVPIVYAEIGQISKLTGDAAVVDEGPKGNVFNQFIDLISKIFSPILWPLAGIGLLKAFLALFTTFGVLAADSTTYTILNAAALNHVRDDRLRAVEDALQVHGNHHVNGNRLLRILRDNPGIRCYVLNTGRMGGKEGANITPDVTCSTIRGAMRETLEWRYDDILGYEIPRQLEIPRSSDYDPYTWYSREKYAEMIGGLRRERREYLQQFKGLAPEVTDAV